MHRLVGLFLTGSDLGGLPDGMPARLLTERWFAKTYGFTPDQVAQLPVEALDWFPLIEQAEAEAARQKQRQAERAARNQQGGLHR